MMGHMYIDVVAQELHPAEQRSLLKLAYTHEANFSNLQLAPAHREQINMACSRCRLH